MLKKITSLLLLLISVFFATAISGCSVVDATNGGGHVNLVGYELVFEDDFDGTSLNRNLWDYRASGRRKGGFFHPDQVLVKNGNLEIVGEYTVNKYGEGWYAGMITTVQDFCYGYYEISCKCNASNDFWSAFWMTVEGVYEHDVSQGGIYGAEIDIFETYKNKESRFKNRVTSTIHCNGGDDDVKNIDSKLVSVAKVDDLYSTYNTFGLLWTENEYIFYVNGVETGRTSFSKGTSRVKEKVIISLCIPNEITLPKTTMTKFVVDYVKIYQKPTVNG